MPKQNRLLVPITLVIAAVFVGGVGYVVLKNGSEKASTPSPASGSGSGASSTTVGSGLAALVGPPVAIDASRQIQGQVARGGLPAGSTFAAGSTTEDILPVRVPSGMTPADAVLDPNDVKGLVTIAAIPPDAILTKSMFGAALAPPPTPGPITSCSADAALPGTGSDVVGIAVRGAIPRGMSAGIAAKTGLLQLVSVPAQFAPPRMVTTLNSICPQAAQFDLSPGTVLVTGLFA